MEWPDPRPAYPGIRVDPMGVAWLKQFAIEGAAVEQWSLLHPERRSLGDLALPPHRPLLSIEPDALLLIASSSTSGSL